MNLLFVNTNQTRMPDPVPPIGLSYLTGAMRRAQHDCDIFDLTFQSQFEEKFLVTFPEFTLINNKIPSWCIIEKPKSD